MVNTIGIVAKNKSLIKDYKREILRQGLQYGLKNADLILSLGGDGTLLESERKYPGIPKLLIRDSKVCEKCNINAFDKFLDKILEEKYKVESYRKLECYINNKKTRFNAVNDIIIRNKEITQAIRFEVHISNKKLGEFIGDGVVVSTPFGSTAYYESITGTSFKKGLGLAFNNVKNAKHKVIESTNTIKLIINRGAAIIGCDNYRQKCKVKPYDQIIIKKLNIKTNIVKLED